MIEKVSLFSSKREFFIFLSALTFIFFYSLLIEWHNFKSLTQFDSNIVNAVVLKQYIKEKITKKGKIHKYQMLKMKSEKGFTFYTGTSFKTEYIVGKRVSLELKAGEISFYEYMKSFYASSYILNIQESFKYSFNSFIASSHSDVNAVAIYQALYSATSLPKELQQSFSNLGISHLFAISGFHIGILSGVLLFLLKFPYSFFQDRYFPYRNSSRDIFVIIFFLLLSYLLFLDSPASLTRALTMLVIGFILYDRGLKVISMQTLLLTVLLLLAFIPRYVFELGFWLSVSGVFYIFLFLIHFKHLSKTWQFILVPFWVYFLMLPYSVVIFENFSLYHYLSILWTTLFSLFYPLSIFLHLIGFGNLLDGLLNSLIDLGSSNSIVKISFNWLYGYVILSLLSIFQIRFIYLLIIYALSFFIYSIYHIT